MSVDCLLMDNIRFNGELNNLHYFERQRVIHNINKQDYLSNLKKRFSKGEYNLLLQNLGKTILEVYGDKLPMHYIDTYWIDNLDKLASIEKDIITFNFKEDNANKYVGCFYYDTTVDKLNSLEDKVFFKVKCKLTDISMPYELPYGGFSFQNVTLFDNDSSDTVDAVICNEYVNNYKWKHGCEVKLLGYTFTNDLFDLPNYFIIAIDYDEDYSRKTQGSFNIVNTERNSPEYKYWRKNILKRDDVCQCCGSDDSLEVHHIFSYKYHKDLRVHPDNGVVLCKKCHNKYHSKYGKIATPDKLFRFIKEYSPHN